MSEPKPMDPEMDERVRWMCRIAEPGQAMNVEGRALLDAHDYWRGRCPVTAGDVMDRKLSRAQAIAWAEPRGHRPIRNPHIVEEYEAQHIATAINALAIAENMPAFDILDEMAAMDALPR